MALDQLRRQLGARVTVVPKVCPPGEIGDLIDRAYGYAMSIDGIVKELEAGEADLAKLDAAEAGYAHPLVRLVDAILLDAVKVGASDIHFEPEELFLRLRYRIDGVLSQIRSFHREHWPAIAQRLKIVAGMNIADKLRPQDGRIDLNLGARAIDLRVSSLPTVHGENIVLRVLDKTHSLAALDQLGISAPNLALIERALRRPEGIFIVTGPTGSGKTTTLYAILGQISTPEVNVVTLEDPVEYQLPLLRQTQVRESTGLGFAEGVRALLRQDPDIVFIGEVRDAEYRGDGGARRDDRPSGVHDAPHQRCAERDQPPGRARPAAEHDRRQRGRGAGAAAGAQALPGVQGGPACERRGMPGPGRAGGPAAPDLRAGRLRCLPADRVPRPRAGDRAVADGRGARRDRGLGRHPLRAQGRGPRQGLSDHGRGRHRQGSGGRPLAREPRARGRPHRPALSPVRAMPQYAYRAINTDGRQLRGALAAANELDLEQALGAVGLELIDCRPKTMRRDLGLRSRRLSSRDLIQLCVHLEQLQRAGVPLLDGLVDVRDSADSTRLRDLVAEIHRDVSEGQPLSVTFGRHPKVFSNVFTALIAAGEETGKLADSFHELIRHLKWAAAMATRVRKATRYPAVVACVVTGVTIFMLAGVVPQVVEFLTANNAELPIWTLALIATSNFVRDFWPLVLALPVATAAALRLLVRRSPEFAYRFDAFLLGLPVVGEVLQKIALARFAQIFAVMFKSGIDILTCLDAGRRVTGNRVLGEALALARPRSRPAARSRPRSPPPASSRPGSRAWSRSARTPAL